MKLRVVLSPSKEMTKRKIDVLNFMARQELLGTNSQSQMVTSLALRQAQFLCIITHRGSTIINL
jgi:hypothetical protein